VAAKSSSFGVLALGDVLPSRDVDRSRRIGNRGAGDREANEREMSPPGKGFAAGPVKAGVEKYRTIATSPSK
jgi:hypothetical protein